MDEQGSTYLEEAGVICEEYADKTEDHQACVGDQIGPDEPVIRGCACRTSYRIGQKRAWVLFCHFLGF